MPVLELDGPYDLDTATVTAKVTRICPGAYVLGNVDRDNAFHVAYIGRADTNIARRLLAHAEDGAYTKFKYGYCETAKSAFEKQCRLYHDFELEGRDPHPDRKPGREWTCPVCRIFD